MDHRGYYYLGSLEVEPKVVATFEFFGKEAQKKKHTNRGWHGNNVGFFKSLFLVNAVSDYDIPSKSKV